MTEVTGPKRPPLWYRVFLGAVALALLVPVWAGVRTVQAGSIALGTLLVAVGFVTVALYIRGLRHVLTGADPRGDPSAFLTSERYLDYIIWVVIGVPLLLIGILLITLLSDALTG